MLRFWILRDSPVDPVRAASDRERFGRFERALVKAGFEASQRLVPDEESLRAELRAERPELVFSTALLCAPGGRGRAGVHRVLEEEGVPYVGSDAAVLELAIDKAALKSRWVERGVRTPPFALVAAGGAGLDEALGLGFPCIVKPSREGNSRGIDEASVVRDPAALRAAVERCRASYGPALVERFIGDGGAREFTVALIGNGPGALVLPAEISLTVAKSVRLVTTADKDGHRTRAEAVAEPDLRERLADFARAAFLAAGVRDYARCDLILAGGELHAIEINGQPMVPDLWFEACAAGAGLDEEGYLAAVVEAAVERLASEGRGPGASAGGGAPR